MIMLDKSRLQFCMVYSATTVDSIAAQVHERDHNADENDKFSHVRATVRRSILRI
jgi:hypothetical protein